MRQRKKLKPRGSYNDYRHILWEGVRGDWIVMMPRVCRAIIKNKHEFSFGQVRALKRNLASRR